MAPAMRTGRSDEWPVEIALRHATVTCIVRRSPRARRLRITLDMLAGPVVSVPSRIARTRAAAESAARDFVAEREEWLLRHLAVRERRLAAAAVHAGTHDGAILQFRGEPHRLRLYAADPGTRRTAVMRSGADDCDELVVVLSTRERRSPEAILEAWFRERARATIEREIARHAAALQVSPVAITIRDQRSRWGSCSRAGRLSFSWRLVLAPPEVLETVVVHELAHLRVFGHGPRFWDLVAGRVPEYKRWRRWLRDHSLELHAALDASIAEHVAAAAPRGLGSSAAAS